MTTIPAPKYTSPMRQISNGDFRGGKLQPVDFSSHVSSRPEGQDSFSCPIRSPIVGDEVDPGQLFAYLFRRFGYPELSWDGQKDLVVYYLTTPHPDLTLAVRPSLSGAAHFSFMYLATEHKRKEIYAYEKRPITQWWQRAYDWSVSQGIPEWMPNWVELFNNEYLPQFYPNRKRAKSWLETLDAAHVTFAEGESAENKLSIDFTAFYVHISKSYGEIEAYPNAIERAWDLATWADEDPLKELASAAQAAINELRRPVPVRDALLAGWGPEEGKGRKVKHSASAGFASGAMGNIDPATFGQLQSLISALGKGDPAAGMSKALKALEAEKARLDSKPEVDKPRS